MKLNITNLELESFMEALDHCKGQIFLTTNEGDKVNLKSKLSQLVGLEQIIKGAKLADAEIVCELKEDELYLIKFIMSNPANDN